MNNVPVFIFLLFLRKGKNSQDGAAAPSKANDVCKNFGSPFATHKFVGRSRLKEIQLLEFLFYSPGLLHLSFLGFSSSISFSSSFLKVNDEYAIAARYEADIIRQCITRWTCMRTVDWTTFRP